MLATAASFGPYFIEGTIGRGGMGVVYRARHRESGDRVALKTARLRSSDLAAVMRREARALAQLRHPGVVRLLDSDVSAGDPWFAMDLLEGRTLAQWLDGTDATTARASRALEETAPLEHAPPRGNAPGRRRLPSSGPRRPLADVLGVSARLCGTLSYLHGSGFVHRDLKPENVVLQAGDRPVLVDFGIAAELASSHREVPDVVPAAGTFAYAAPEQRTGVADARSDLFSFGAILYEGITGTLPFGPHGPLESELVEPPPPSSFSAEVPGELDELILRLLRRNMQERPDHASDVERVLVRSATFALAS